VLRQLWQDVFTYDFIINIKRTDITKTESVQQSFTKRLTGLSNLSHTKRLEVLDSLEIRRLHYDLFFFVYKILIGFVDLTTSYYFTLRTGSKPMVIVTNCF